MQDAAGDQPLRLLEEWPRVEAVASAGQDQGGCLDGAVAGGKVETVLRLNRGRQVAKVAEPSAEPGQERGEQGGAHVEVSALVAEPGPLVAKKLQAIMNRAAAKQGTDLQDIARLILDGQARPAALAQLGSCGTPTAADTALHVDLWLVGRRRQALRWIHDAGGTDLTLDDLDLVTELLLTACARC